MRKGMGVGGCAVMKDKGNGGVKVLLFPNAKYLLQ